MQKTTTTYDTAVDALVAVTKRLAIYEDRHGMTSEDFFDRYTKGALQDTQDFVEWANDYKHFMALKLELERTTQHVS